MQPEKLVEGRRVALPLRHSSRRRFLSLAATGTAGALLAACSAAAPTPPPAKPTETDKPSTPPSTAAAPPSGASPQLIHYVLYGTPTKLEVMKGVQRRFESVNPGKKVELTLVQASTWGDFDGKLAAMIAAGQPLDLTEIPSEGVHSSASRGLVKPIDDLVRNDRATMQEYFSDVAPVLVEASMYGGSLHVLPRLVSPAVLFYNTQLLAQSGIERPKDDWTVADFLEIAKKIASTKPGTAGFAWPNRLWGGAVPWFFVFGGNLYEQSRSPGAEWLWSGFYKDDPNARGRAGGISWGAPKANSPEMVEALGFLQDLTFVHRAAPPPTAFDDLANLFAAGKLAMLTADRSLVGRLRSAEMKETDFDILPMPAARTQRHQFGASSIALLKSSASPEIAWPFMTFLVSRSEIDTWVKGGVDTSSRRSVANDPKQHDGLGPAHWQLFYDALDKHSDSGPIPAPAQAKQMTAILIKWVRLAMDNELSAKDALDGMQADLLELDRKPGRPP